MADLPRWRCTSADTSSRRCRSDVRAAGSCIPAGARRALCTPTSRDVPRMLAVFEELVRAVPARGVLHDRRHRRRSGDPARGAGASASSARTTSTARRRSGSIAHELAHQWFGNSVGVAQWQRHLAQRGLRVLRRVAVVGGLGRPDGRTSTRRRHHARLASLPQDLVLSDPGPDSCSTTGSTSAAR